MIAELLTAVSNWKALLVVLVVWGLAPKLVLRVIVLAFADYARRDELLAEIHVVPRWERPLWVFEQLETAVSEGLRDRLVDAAAGRLYDRWHLVSGVAMNGEYPESFWIPSEQEKSQIRPGSLVKLCFSLSHDRWGERMWVTVIAVRGGRLTGELDNQPVGIPRLQAGTKVKFRAEHIIDIHQEPHATDRHVRASFGYTVVPPDLTQITGAVHTPPRSSLGSRDDS